MPAAILGRTSEAKHEEEEKGGGKGREREKKIGTCGKEGKGK